MIYLTVPSEEEGSRLIQGLLGHQLIACGTISPPVTSFFIWEDNIQNDTERVLWLKTPLSLQQQVIQYLTQNHSYTLPFIAVFTPSVSQEIAQWAEKACLSSEKNASF
jgi:periplasmic divalent cation tolerance protein